MESWSVTLRIVAIMTAVAVSYLAGRWVAETLQSLVAGGILPTL